MDNIILEAHPEGPVEVSFKTVIKGCHAAQSFSIGLSTKGLGGLFFNAEELSTHKRKVCTFPNEYSFNSSLSYILHFIYICPWVIVLIDFHYLFSPP